MRAHALWLKADALHLGETGTKMEGLQGNRLQCAWQHGVKICIHLQGQAG